MHKYLLNQLGNLDDIKNSIRCSWALLTVDDFKKALNNELKNQNRKSLIKLLEAKLKKKQKEVQHG